MIQEGEHRKLLPANNRGVERHALTKPWLAGQLPVARGAPVDALPHRPLQCSGERWREMERDGERWRERWREMERERERVGEMERWREMERDGERQSWRELEGDGERQRHREKDRGEDCRTRWGTELEVGPFA